MRVSLSPAPSLVPASPAWLPIPQNNPVLDFLVSLHPLEPPQPCNGGASAPVMTGAYVPSSLPLPRDPSSLSPWPLTVPAWGWGGRMEVLETHLPSTNIPVSPSRPGYQLPEQLPGVPGAQRRTWGPGDGEGDHSLPPPMCPTPQPLCMGQHPPPHRGESLPQLPELRSRRGCWGRRSWKKRETEAQEGGKGLRDWPMPRKSLGMWQLGDASQGGLSETKKQGLPKESSILPSRCLPQFPQSSQA